MTLFKYIINPSPIGEITIIWRKKPKFQIEEIILSRPDKSSSKIAEEKYEQEEPLAINKKSKQLNNVIKELNNYFHEKNPKFSLEYLNLDKCTPFQRKVLEEEFKTEKGTINTYKDLAKAAGSPKAYGGFGGVAEGLESKKILLELDGLMIQDKKVVGDSPIIALDKTSQTKLV